jgi:hypothetical protein
MSAHLEIILSQLVVQVVHLDLRSAAVTSPDVSLRYSFDLAETVTNDEGPGEWRRRGCRDLPCEFAMSSNRSWTHSLAIS